MIKNERQYRITKSQLEQLIKDLDRIESPVKDESHETRVIRAAEAQGLESLITELKAELKEYETLWMSRRPIDELRNFCDLPSALIKARLSLGLTQKDLGQRLGLSEQQVQRYEATDYEAASLRRIREVIYALGLQISKDLAIPESEKGLISIVKKIEHAGIDREFVRGKLLPSGLVVNLKGQKGAIDSSGTSGLNLARQLSAIFGWTPEQLYGQAPLLIDTSRLGTVKYKVRKGLNQTKLAAYTLYAHYLGMIVLQSTSHLVRKTLPKNPYEIHREIVNSKGAIDFELALRYVWSLGVPILALNLDGGFQGAYFRENNRDITIVNYKTSSASMWLFTLFHEFWHVLNEKHETTKMLRLEDVEGTFTHGTKADPDEKNASLFASAVLLGRNPDALVHQVLKDANKDIARLKESVIKTSKEQGVSLESLANYTAYRVSMEGHNWWGTARNLQESNAGLQNIARDVLLNYVDLSHISGADMDILRRALGFAEVVING